MGGIERVREVAGLEPGANDPTDCVRRVVLVPENDRLPALDMALPTAEGQLPFWVVCGTAVADSFWATPAEVVDHDDTAASAAQRYVQEVLGPSVHIGYNPGANVLVGLPTWFWAEGWDGSPVSIPTIEALGDRVDITLSLLEARWGFGDGAGLVGGLGQAYPRESSVAHTYTVRSTSPSAPAGAYQVTLGLRIAVTYWLNGEGPYSAAPLTYTLSRPIVVHQLQAVIR